MTSFVVPSIMRAGFLLSGCGGSNSKDFPCSAKLFSESFEDQTLQFCHLDTNQDGIYQTSEALFVKEEGQWFSLQDIETFQRYQKKFGLPNFAGLSLDAWHMARNFVYFSGAKSWNIETEKKLSEVTDYHIQKGIPLTDNVLAAIGASGIDYYHQPSSRHQLDVLSVMSVLHYIKAKLPVFYQNNRNFVDLVWQKIEAGKLSFLEGSSWKADYSPTDASYNDLSNSMRLTNPDNLNMKEFDGFIVHELFHFYQDILKSKISVTEREVAAYLVEADYNLSQTELYDGEPSSEKLESFIEEYRQRTKIAKPPDGSEFDYNLVYALRKVYYQKHQDKLLEEENLRKFFFVQENSEVDLMVNLLVEGEVHQLLETFEKLHPDFDTLALESQISILDELIKRKAKLAEDQVSSYSEYLKSTSNPDPSEIEKYYINTIKLHLGILLYSGIRSKLQDQTVVDSTLLLFQMEKSISELYFNRHLLVQMDGVE